jgi:hypothetical protein
MPLHDWTSQPGWDGVHHLWIAELLRWVKPRLPAGFRAYVGMAPTLAVGAPSERPDVGVRGWQPDPELESFAQSQAQARPSSIEPDVEVAVVDLDPGTALFVERHGRLVAAVELISPRNKDRPIARETFLTRYVGYLLEAVHLLLVDVHPRPLGFSFADRIGEVLHLAAAPCPAPLAVSYRVGEPAAAGSWRSGVGRSPSAPRCPHCPCP